MKYDTMVSIRYLTYLTYQYILITSDARRLGDFEKAFAVFIGEIHDPWMMDDR